MGVPFENRTIQYEDDHVEENMYQPTEPSTKNSSYLKGGSKHKMSSAAKTECVKTEKSIK